MLAKLLSIFLSLVMMSTFGQSSGSPIELQKESEETIKVEDSVKTKSVSYSSDDFETILAEFSSNIYNSLSDNNTEKDNIIFSPLSVMYALSLAANGAEDETLKEFEALFGGNSINQMNEHLLTLTSNLMESKDSKVVVGNSIWANKDVLTFSREYLSILGKYYSAEARSVPFNQNTVGEINNWVKEKTDGMIDHAIDTLSPDLATVLLNTVLFDGKWEKEYNDNDISDGKFFNYDGSTSDVEYLYSKENGAYFEVDGGVGFRKAYKDGYSFTAVLPNGNIDEFLNNTDIADIISAAKNTSENVRVYIPKFEYEYSKSLNAILKEMGLNTAFTPNADFDKMSATGDADIMISSIFQKAKIILNEHGTKAAAVTGIAYATTAMPVRPDRIIRLEKPFLYIIQDSNGNPLFIGTVYGL